jgi:hypothetical protein
MRGVNARIRGKAMTYMQQTNVEHRARAAVAWATEGYDGRSHYREVLIALVPAFSIILAAALFLFH